MIGPLVVPGATVCLGCLALRIARRWGDPPPVAEPAAIGDPGLLDELTATAEPVLAAAGCPACPAVPIGRITLPWAHR